jgi:hypothetical protein
MICAVILFAVPSDPLRSDVVKVHPLKREDAREQEGVWEICSMTNPDCTSLVKHNFQNHFVANVLPLPDLFCHFLPYLVLLIICLLSEDAVKVHPLKREDTMAEEWVWEIIEAFQWLWKQTTKSGELEQFYLLLLKDNTSPGYDKTAYLYPSTGGKGRKEQALPP